MRAALGLAVVAAHAAAFLGLAARCRGTELSVEVAAPAASEALAIVGVVPAALTDRVVEDVADGAPPGPGLHRKRWSVAYRGGFERAVGAAQLVGPFQDPTHPACTGRVVVAQRLLDDGRAGPGTVAAEMAKSIDAELRGERIFPIGDYQRIDQLSLRWAQLAAHPEDLAMVGAAPHGYVRVSLTVRFARVDVPLVIALVPQPATTELTFRIATRAELEFGNRVAQWLSDKLGGDKLATRLARRQLDQVLARALAPPPPFELAGGQRLRFGYCSDPLEIVDGAWGALPFAVQIERDEREPTILPPRRGPAPRATIAPTAALAIDLDVDALNALLFELWRGGFLDRQLVAAGLHTRFNADPIVTELLSIRISPIHLALPPVIAATSSGLRLAADARLAIAGGGEGSTTGRLWGGLDFRFATSGIDAVAVDLAALELSCERGPTTLIPCYADLVAALRGRGADLHGALTTAFTRLLSDLFVERRLAAAGLPAELVIQRAVPRITTSGQNASLHLDLDASLRTSR